MSVVFEVTTAMFTTMKRGTITGLLGALTLGGFTLGAFAEVKENPYQVIIDRNPFGLKAIPIPEPPKPPEPPVIPPPDVKLTGITTLGAAPKVFLQIEDKQTKGKAEFPPPLAVGETHKDITVLMIDPENNVVRIKNGEVELTLDFEKNGVKPGAGAVAAVPNPGLPAFNPGGVPPAPGMVANPLANSGRGILAGGTGNTTATAVPNAPAVNYAQPNYGSPNVPPRPIRESGLGITAGGGNQTYNPQPTVPTATPIMSREDAEARLELQRRALEQQGNSGARLLPPTSLGRSLNLPPAPGK